MEPVTSARRGRDQTTWHVLQHAHLVFLAVLPRRGTHLHRPVVRVALAAQAHQHGAGSMEMRLRVAPARVLRDKPSSAGILDEAAECRLDAAIAWCALIVQRELGIDDVGKNVRAYRCATAYRLHLELRLRFEEVVTHVVALIEVPVVVEDEAVALEDIEDTRRVV